MNNMETIATLVDLLHKVTQERDELKAVNADLIGRLMIARPEAVARVPDSAGDNNGTEP